MRDVRLRMATADDAHLPTFDFTKLAAVNSCPRFGIIRYTHHKTPAVSSYRNMALEAGSVMHECFSAIRLWQLGYAQGQPDLMRVHGVRLFGRDRWDNICTPDLPDGTEGLRTIALECLSTSGFADSPDDKRRTYSNLETSLLYYCQRWDHTRYPVWVRDPSDPTSDVGIEIPFDMVVDVAGKHNRDGSQYALNLPSFRYTGRVDGIHVDKGGELLVQENKTASRLGEAWRMSFNTSHQVTGYCVAASVFADTLVERAIVLGIGIPLPRTMSDGLAMESVTRHEHMRSQWLDWLSHTVHLHDRFKDDPLAAPMYTHSCNRYFSPCSLIPLCAGDPEEQELALAEMTEDRWSPLDESN